MPSCEASRNGSRGNGSRRSRTTSRKSTRRPAKWSRSRPERRTESSRGEAAGRDEGRKEGTPKRKGREKRDGTRTEGMGCTPLAEGISFRPPSTSRRIVGVGSMVPRDYVDEVISSLFEDAVDPKISVVGVGGAGGKMVSALYDREIKGVETVAVNTDPAGTSKAEGVIVLDNNSLDRFADQLSFNEAMQVISFMVVTIVKGVVDHLSRSYLSTLTEEIENAAREIEEQNNHAVPVDVQPPETVQAAWDLGPVAFDDQGFIGLR